MRWARIEGGVVRETVTADPAGRYHPSLTFIPCPDAVREGHLFDGARFVSPPPISTDPAPSPAERRLAAIERAIEAGGSATLKAALAAERAR